MPFDAHWLALREPADYAARDPGLLTAATDAAGDAPHVVDLACGTGSTWRAFDAGFRHSARWRLVDHDPHLLEAARALLPDSLDLLRADISRPQDLPLDGASLLTASALLDLVSEAWVEDLAEVLAARRLPFYAALSYDGRMIWEPRLPGDVGIVEAFNRDQRRDKGFGPALGPCAADTTARIFADRGWHVRRAPSDWRLGAGETALHHSFTEGVAHAAAENGAKHAEAWLASRTAPGYPESLTVGHIDVLALPPGFGDKE